MTTTKKPPRAVIAGAGLVDLFAEKLQEYGPKLQAKAQKLPSGTQKFAAELPDIAKDLRKRAKNMPTKLARMAQHVPSAAQSLRTKAKETDFKNLRSSAAGVTETANQTAHTVADSTVAFYQKLVKRGERIMAERNGSTSEAADREARSAEKKETTAAPTKQPARKKAAGKPTTRKPTAKPKKDTTKPTSPEAPAS